VDPVVFSDSVESRSELVEGSDAQGDVEPTLESVQIRLGEFVHNLLRKRMPTA
jgi:hypothetical protein